MLDQILNRYADPSKRAELEAQASRTAFKRKVCRRLFPNAVGLSIVKLGLSIAHLAYGQEKIDRELTFKHSDLITASNKYLDSQLLRLWKFAEKKDSDKFNKLADILLTRSVLFRLACLNYNWRNWFLQKPSKFNRIWRRLTFIADTGSSDLRMKRVWIDKQPGDYGRPLGVPEIEWRVYLLMRVQILEIWYLATGQITSWQHGAVHGRGLGTCWSELIKKVLDKSYIYEFDIKGFFDNVNVSNILKDLGDKWNSWAREINLSKPIRYKLPPEKLDLAFLEINSFKTQVRIDKSREGLNTDYRMGNYTVWSHDLKDAVIAWTKWILDEQPDGAIYEAFFSPADGLPLYSDGIHDFKEAYVSFLNKEHTHVWLKTAAPEPGDREVARDSWKGLDKSTGVAQGANTSPFLACLALHKAVGDMDGLIMYMDDGLIYGETQEEVDQNIQKFKEKLDTLGLQLEPKKSGYVKQEGRMVRPMKFLGIKTEDGVSLTSATRSGTKEDFLNPVTTEEFVARLGAEGWHPTDALKELERFRKEGLPHIPTEKEFVALMGIEGVSASMARVAHWVLKKQEALSGSLVWAVKNNVFNNLCAEAFSPGGKLTNELKSAVGALDAKERMFYRPGLMNPLPDDLLFKGRKEIRNVALTTISTRMCEALVRTVTRKRVRVKALNFQ